MAETEGDGVVEERESEDPFDTLIEWHAFDTADAPPSARTGTAEDPHPIGSRFEIDGWHVVVNLIDPDAETRLLALAPENPSPDEGKRYVLVHMTVNNPSEETLPVSRLSVYYDTPKQLYSARRGGVEVTPDPALFIDANRLLVGTFSGYIAFQTDDVPGLGLRISSLLDRERVYVEVPAN